MLATATATVFVGIVVDVAVATRLLLLPFFPSQFSWCGTTSQSERLTFSNGFGWLDKNYYYFFVSVAFECLTCNVVHCVSVVVVHICTLHMHTYSSHVPFDIRSGISTDFQKSHDIEYRIGKFDLLKIFVLNFYRFFFVICLVRLLNKIIDHTRFDGIFLRLIWMFLCVCANFDSDYELIDGQFLFVGESNVCVEKCLWTRLKVLTKMLITKQKREPWTKTKYSLNIRATVDVCEIDFNWFQLCKKYERTTIFMNQNW